MKRILLADDSTFMRGYIKNLIEQDNTCKVVAEASNGEDAVSKYVSHKPDVVLMDITMEHVNGLTALKAIRSFDPHAQVIMCSAMGTQQYVIEAIKSGAKDFIVKPYFENLVSKINELTPRQAHEELFV
ncbi:response regulator [Salirhabdus sp. Marseille-P4669]|uniref:response regulator n=1 Tax=Salirhabdus sp. Marseille-P4669 TaxID=2042310 RepID=UPI000C798DF4|nr:response regulator [Salirhabdus sp. Marseille-P4669]